MSKSHSDSRRYRHDCDLCIYLGQFGKHDAYYCPASGELVARYSDNGPDYMASPANSNLHGTILVVVKRMAEKAGYLHVVD